MKIGIFSDNFYPEMSGITDSIITLVKNLVKYNHQVVFFVPEYKEKDFKVIDAEFREIDLGPNVKVVRFFALPYPLSTGQGRLVLPTIWRWWRVKKEKLDIIHTQDFFGMGIEALIAAKLLKIPLVGTNHTMITEFLNYCPVKNKLAQDWSRRFVSWYYNKCGLATAPSRSILDEMKNFGLHKPSQVISNPIELKDYLAVNDDLKNNLKKEFNLSGHTVLCSGRLATEKHVDVVIKAINIVKTKLPDINLVITGSGVAKESLQQLVIELKLEDNVKFLGFVEPEILKKIYQAADIYAIASTAETQSISLMKAMSVGLPVIGVRAWALPEYINDNNGFVVELGDYEAIAAKIILLCQDENLRQRLSQGGQATVRDFSEENIAKQWEKIYNNIVENCRSK